MIKGRRKEGRERETHGSRPSATAGRKVEMGVYSKLVTVTGCRSP
jgi:hypothetical protein